MQYNTDILLYLNQTLYLENYAIKNVKWNHYIVFS